ncbi:virulence protein RhuM/Fic/DOC family protein [Lacimicrobium alkaliphilum]|uniref:Fido domain-containing protein n=1 Tax=Lacimicrobium alkaliphilum TaxID=1526571 RepID=A0ABQ1RE53_9ALTE|nr:virulence protein RhuM/Fic/DOC family protein [Lacimicrobium alkaliphilum]GGD66736.1 hypothetical protein GCM10011357_22490 [Lacimicrobium alkaliphilum]
MSEQQIEIFESKDGQASIEVRFDGESLWLSQAQMAELFGKDLRTINEHIKNIFKEQELIPSQATIRKFRIVRQEGKRRVQREIDHYNLDMAISVGYRVNSKKGTQFRIWATQRLREYLEKGYSLNQTVFGAPAYPTIESKAAHLLYFIVKNHPFTDGNKRSGAFLFVDFLQRNNRLINTNNQPCINDTGLAALTLLVAESKAEQKETMINLIMNMLAS